MTIGKRIKKKRSELKLTLQDIANVFNISRAAVSEWESDRSTPGVDKLPLLAKKLKTSVSFLISGFEEKPHPEDRRFSGGTQVLSSPQQQNLSELLVAAFSTGQLNDQDAEAIEAFTKGRLSTKKPQMDPSKLIKE